MYFPLIFKYQVVKTKTESVTRDIYKNKKKSLLIM